MRELFCLLLLLVIPDMVRAQDLGQNEKTPSYSCNGQWYKVKKDKTPVFEEPAQDSRVLVYLEEADRVCYVGEKNDFAIVDRLSIPSKAQKEVDSLLSASKEDEEAGNRFVYLRVSQLWATPTKKKDEGVAKEVFSRLKGMYNDFRYGGVPEDGLLPYRPFIELFQERYPESRAIGGGNVLPGDQPIILQDIKQDRSKPEPGKETDKTADKEEK